MEAALIADAQAAYPGLNKRGTSALAHATFIVDAANQAKRPCALKGALGAFLHELKISTLAPCK